VYSIEISNPAHHFGIHIHLTKKQKRKTVDTMAYIIGIGGNVAVIPQIIKAWSSDAPGLAVSTWIMFICFGLVWLAYAETFNRCRYHRYNLQPTRCCRLGI